MFFLLPKGKRTPHIVANLPAQLQRQFFPKKILCCLWKMSFETKRKIRYTIFVNKWKVDLKRYVVGWVNYYKLADMGTYLQSIDEWMRRRIRMVFWKKWKRVRTRWRNLLKLGISNANAGILANSRKEYWRIAADPLLQTALSNRRLERAEFQFFYPYYRKSVAV